MKTKTIEIGELKIRFNIFIAILVILLAIGLARLGFWQLSRATEKIQLQDNFELKALMNPVPVDDLQLTGLTNDSALLQNSLVSLQGHYVNDQNIFLVYQPYRDQPGYEIVTPFKLDSNGTYVMVSRGWAMAESMDALSDKIKPVEGKLNLLGQLYIPSEKEIDLSNNLNESVEWPLFIRYMNTIELLPHFDNSIFPYVIRLNENQPGVLVRHWPTVFVETSHHYTYAMQWFAMSVAAIVAALFLSSNARTLWNIKFIPD